MPCPMFARVFGLLLLPAAHGAIAQQLDLTARDATAIVEGCGKHARDKGQSHAIAVHDAGGAPVAVLRMDGNSSGVMAFATRKAEAVAHWRFATTQMQEAARNTPGFAEAPYVVTVAGGVPVFSSDGQRFLGAVGVSGEAPADDAACAEAGIRAAGLLTARKPRP